MIRVAETKDLNNVVNFYNALIDSMKHAKIDIGWRKGIYPSLDFLDEAIKNKTLFILEKEKTIAGAMILNHHFTEGYEKIKWGSDAPQESILIIHTLGIAEDYRGKGLAQSLVEFAIDYANSHNMKAIRLDVLKKNAPAQKLYEQYGFEYKGGIDLYYENTGLTDFYLYEKLLK